MKNIFGEDMRSVKGCLSVLIACLLFSGCAFNPQKVNIAPTVDVSTSDEGKGVSVAVRVSDERASKSLGHRGSEYGAAAEITTTQDVAEIVQKQLVDGLQKKGFSAGESNLGSNAKLNVEVRLLDYSTSTGFWTGGVNIKCTLKAVATDGEKTYENMYRVDNEERVVVVPTAETNEQWINTALSDALKQLLDDKALLSALDPGVKTRAQLP